MLYIVSTPIGNLKDITYRAVEVLQTVNVIYAEDTRRTTVLLNAYNIKKPLVSYHKYNEKQTVGEIVERLVNGEDIALVSDAGAPLISDPGCILVQELVKNNLQFTHISGACALISALILGGLSTERFIFIGFLPQKNKARKELLEKYKYLDVTLAFYSAPHNVKQDIADIYSVFGERTAVAVREISKVYEEREQFMLSQGLTKEPRGEYVILVSGYEDTKDFKNLTIEDHVQQYIDMGYSKIDAIKEVAKERGLKKNEVYNQVVKN